MIYVVVRKTGVFVQGVYIYIYIFHFVHKLMQVSEYGDNF